MVKKSAKRQKRAGVYAVNPADHAVPAARLQLVTPVGAVVREATAVREDRPDPDSAVRTVRGWRAASPLDHIRSPRITRDHRLAATRFAETLEAIAAAGYGHTARLPTGLPPGLSAAVVGPSEAALHAVADHRGACQAVGMIGSAVLMAVLIDGRPVSEIDDGGLKVALGRLLGVLDRLMEHYDATDGRRK